MHYARLLVEQAVWDSDHSQSSFPDYLWEWPQLWPLPTKTSPSRIQSFGRFRSSFSTPPQVLLTRSGSSAFFANLAGLAITLSSVSPLSSVLCHLLVISLLMCSNFGISPFLILRSFLGFHIRYVDSGSIIIRRRCLPSLHFFFFFFSLSSGGGDDSNCSGPPAVTVAKFRPGQSWPGLPHSSFANFQTSC